ncbi:MAG: methylmalonyl-CoA epimerase [Bacillota bacterium]
MRIDHLGIAVADLEQALESYRALGLEPTGSEEVPEQRVTVTFLPIGESKLELLCPTGPEGPIAKFLADGKKGLHHVALAVDDIEAALEKARQAGLRLIDERPRRGAGGALIAFVHPASTAGVLIELCQRKGSH